MNIEEKLPHLKTFFTRKYGFSDVYIRDGCLLVTIKINGDLKFTNRIDLILLDKIYKQEKEFPSTFIKEEFEKALQKTKNKYGII